MPTVIASAIITFVGATGAAATAITIASYALFAAGLVGLQYLVAQANQPKGEPLKSTTTNAVQPRCRIYGRMLVAGNLNLREAKGSKLYLGHLMVGGRIDGYDLVFVDDRPIQINPNGTVTALNLEDDILDQKVKADIQLGTADQAASPLFLAKLPTLWTADHRARGIATINMEFAQAKPENRLSLWPNGFPIVKAVVRGALLHDPRDTSEDPRDEETWAFRTNCALAVRDFLGHPDGMRLDPDWIGTASFRLAADDCDRATPKFGGGFEPFATANGVYYFDDAARGTLARLLAACDGVLSEGPTGQIELWIAKWEEPEVTLTDDDIASIHFEGDKSRLVAANDYRARWNDPARNYELQDVAPVVDEASVAAFGQRIVRPVTLDMVQSGSQAYRLAYRHSRRDNPKSRLTVRLRPRGLLLVGQRVVRLKLRVLDIDAVYRIESHVNAGGPDGGFHAWQTSLSEVSPDDFADVVPPADPSRSLPLLQQELPDAPVISVTVTTIGGEPYLKVSATDPDDESLTFEAEYRRQSGVDDDYAPYPTALSPYVAQAGPVTDGDPDDVYLTRARFRTATGSPGPWAAAQVTDLS